MADLSIKKLALAYNRMLADLLEGVVFLQLLLGSLLLCVITVNFAAPRISETPT